MTGESLIECPFCGTVPTLKRHGNTLKFRLIHANQLCIFSTVSRAMSKTMLIRLWNKRQSCGDCGGKPQMQHTAIDAAREGEKG